MLAHANSFTCWVGAFLVKLGFFQVQACREVLWERAGQNDCFDVRVILPMNLSQRDSRPIVRSA